MDRLCREGVSCRAVSLVGSQTLPHQCDGFVGYSRAKRADQPSTDGFVKARREMVLRSEAKS